jgi:TP901 family phage tail tape measure protein
MATRFTIEAIFNMIDKVTVPLTRIQNRMQKFTRSTFRGLTRMNRTVDKLSSSLKRMSVVAVAAVVPLGFVIRDLVTTSADFGRAIGVASAIFFGGVKPSVEALANLENKAREVGASTEFTAIQAANGLRFLAVAAFTAEQAVDSLNDIVNFATSSQTELARAADIVSDVQGQFRLKDKDSEKNLLNLNRIMDVMSATANSANTTVEQLFEALKKAGPIAKSSGASIETVMATLGFLGGVGIKGATAGIGLKNIILGLAGVGNQAEKTFKRLGISLKNDLTGDLRDPLSVMAELSEKLRVLGSKERVEIIKALFGKIPISSAASLVSKDVALVLQKVRSGLKGAKGTSGRIADLIRSDLRGSLDALFSSIENVKIAIGKVNEGPLKKMIDGWTKWIRVKEKVIAQDIGGFLLKIIKNFDSIVTWLKNIGIGLVVFITFTTVLKTFILVMTALNLVMTIPGLMVLGVLALIAAFVALVIWIDDVVAGFDKMPIVLRILLAPLEAIIRAIKFIKDSNSFNVDATIKAGAETGELVASVTGATNSANDKASSFLQGLFSTSTGDQKQVTPEVSSTTTNNVSTSSELLIRAKDVAVDVVKNGLGSDLKIADSGAF